MRISVCRGVCFLHLGMRDWGIVADADWGFCLWTDSRSGKPPTVNRLDVGGVPGAQGWRRDIRDEAHS